MTEILLVTNWDWVHCQLTLPLARALRRAGRDVALVSPPGKYVAQLETNGFRHLAWSMERRSAGPVREAKAIASLRRLFARERPRVVHNFTIKASLYGSIASHLADVPVVVNTFPGLGYVFSHGARPAAMRRLVLPVLRRAVRRPNVWTVFENEADRDVLVGNGSVDPARASVIHGGVDTDRFSPGSGDRSSPVVVMASRLLVGKGVGEFEEAAFRLRATWPNCTFALAGEPDVGNPGSVVPSDLDRWRRRGAVELLGHRSDMADVLRRATVAVLPTAYQEGAPRFLMESAAAGLPLVAGDVPGCRVVVVPGENGLLVPPRDAAALAAAIDRLLRDAALRRQMGAASRRIAVERFSEERYAGQYVGLYDALEHAGSLRRSDSGS